MRKVVAIEYWLLGRFEFTCKPLGILIVITPRALAPRATAPPVIEPEMVCDLATAAIEPTITNVRINLSALLFINY